MKPPLLPSALFTALIAISNAHAASVAWNYQGMGGVGLLSTDVAGAPGYEQANWTNHAGSGQGPGAAPLENLVDDAGVATTLDLSGWTMATNNSWQHNQTLNPNEILMNDFNNTQPVLTFAEIPYAAYSVIVYYGNNEGPSTSVLTVGGQARTITTGDTSQSSFRAVGFVEGTDFNTDSPTNFAVFHGFTDPTLSVSFSGATNNGISAVQLVAIPEPSVAALMGFAVMLAGRRRRH